MADAMTNNITNEEILKFAVENGMIDLREMQDKINNMKRSELLKQHKYSIWQGNNGKWYTYIEKGGLRKLQKRNTKIDIENVIVEYLEQNKYLTLQQLFNKWLPYKALKTDATSYARRINNDWNKYYKDTPIADKYVNEMTYLYLDEWAHKLIKQHKMTKKRYYNATIIIRQCLEYACEPELNCIEESPFKRVKIDSKLFEKKKKPDSKTQVYVVSEQQRVAAEISAHYQDKPRHITPLAVLLNFQLGLRIGELVALKWSDISGNYIHVQRMEVRKFKTEQNQKGKTTCIACGCDVVEYTKSPAGDREVYLNETAKDIIQSIRKTCMTYGCFNDDGYMFVSYWNTNRLQCTAVENYIARMCRNIGIGTKSNHKIRKTYISSMFDKGVNIDTIREQAGHESEQTSLHNYCFDPNDNSDIEKKLESVSNSNVRLSV